MRWSSRLGDPQIGLPLVHHSGGLNFEAQPPAGEIDRWFRVADILHLADSGPSINREV